jgi:hypothetical protein
LINGLYGDACGMREPEQPLVSNDTRKQTDNDRFRDMYECEREAAFADAGTKSQVFDNCIKARRSKQN